ncbi:MAG: hypothetical protein SYNGOMJ08_00837 [Candidatus Syntrophoarchaeum sp. GoM_oil]|nr:MAG: hypothetical protein SYNGOMJ08_00837 [Candidatus Syntrophoarchaeum sp. GoM_oil]
MELEDLRSKQAHFEHMRQDRQKDYKNLEKCRRKFIKIFTITKIENMGKDDYVEGKRINGKPDENTFCYWVEWRTEGLGRIQGARADKFGLYVDKKTQQYKFLKKFSNENDAIEFLKTKIVKLIEFGKSENLEKIKEIELSPMFKGKILFLYYPKKFVNIFAETNVDGFLKNLEIYHDNKNLDLIDKREILLGWKNKDSVMKKWSMVEFSDFLYNELGRPPKKEQTPDELKDYIDFEEDYPDPEKAKPEFITLKISPEKIQSSSKKGIGKSGMVDFEKENKRQQRLGEQGELVVFRKEKTFLIENDQKDLAEKVELISKKDTFAGYDILSYELNGTKKYIEVKSTNSSPSNIASFLISINEYTKAKTIKNYNIYIVFETKSENPKIWKIKNPFKYEGKGLYLTSINFRVMINTKESKPTAYNTM